jgi:MFS family permease
VLQSLVAPALPDIQHALHTSVSSVSWVLTAYLLSASIATPLIGRLGDMYGKERLLVVVLVLLCVATIVSAVATSLAVMLAGRVVQGAAGGVFPLAPGQTGVATGINTLARSVGGAFGGAIVASILSGSVSRGPFPSAGGFTTAFAACAIALALGVLVGLAIPRRAQGCAMPCA